MLLDRLSVCLELRTPSSFQVVDYTELRNFTEREKTSTSVPLIGRTKQTDFLSDSALSLYVKKL